MTPFRSLGRPDAGASLNAPAAPASLGRAMLLMSFSSIFVPIAGIVTQPILSRALGATGRGELTAATTPATLLLAAATLGLPEALTYYLAKYPGATRRLLAYATTTTLLLGLLCAALIYLLLPVLSGGDIGLQELILLATAVTVPALLNGVLRGAATGRQLWTAVVTERLIGAVFRVGAFGVLWVLGVLTVPIAVVVAMITPLISSAAYFRLLGRHSAFPLGAVVPLTALMSYGGRVWIGSVTEMLLSRTSQLLMVPLSNTTQLGLFSVAIVISDLPLLAVTAIQSAVFGTSSQTQDADKLGAATRMSLLLVVPGCIVLAAVLPVIVSPIFGSDFAGAIVPTWVLLLSGIVCVPGVIASVGLSAWGRPGLRSVGLVITLTINIIGNVLLIPRMGAVGAAYAVLLSNFFMSSFMIVLSARVTGAKMHSFLLVRRHDVARARLEVVKLCRRVRPARAN